MITAMANAPTATAITLARPSRLVRTDGRPKTPLPIMQLTTRAAMLQRPIARTNPSLQFFSMAVSVTASLYHKWAVVGGRSSSPGIHADPNRSVAVRSPGLVTLELDAAGTNVRVEN